MSDAGNDSDTAAATVPTFTERELQMLSWAMQSLKTAPEVDYDKLASFAGMTNPRSASNAWAKIRAKLQISTDKAPAKSTPKNTPKKKAAAAKSIDIENSENGDEGTPSKSKSPRKRAPKKQEVDGDNGSPKKKGRVARAKKVEEDEDVADVKTSVKAKMKAGPKSENSSEATPPDEQSEEEI